MNIRSLLTKTEYGLLLLTALFLCLLSALLYYTDGAGETADYVIAAERAAEDATPEVLPPLNINTATAEELVELNGIGPVLALSLIHISERDGAKRIVPAITGFPGLSRYVEEAVGIPVMDSLFCAMCLARDLAVYRRLNNAIR